MRATRLGCVFLGAVLLARAVLADSGEGPAPVPEGPFTQGECLDCHAARDPALVAQWRAGPHAAKADCVACHGERHGALPIARRTPPAPAATRAPSPTATPPPSTGSWCASAGPTGPCP